MTRTSWPARLAALLLLFGVGAVRADVRLPHVFGSHMVLQRDMALPVWGWAEPGEEVTVALGAAAPVKATADAGGKWKLTLPAQPAGGPLQMVVQGRNKLVLDDVLLGEVWLCSGQSNMQFTVGGAINAQQEIAAANDAQIRQIAIPNITAGAPAADVNANWVVCSPQTAGGFTAAGYFMARELRKTLGVPVGLVNSSWGGTRIEPWTPPVGFAGVPELQGIYRQVLLTDPRSEPYKARLGDYLKQLDAWLPTARAALTGEQPLAPAPAFPPELRPMNTLQDPQQQPTTLYNAMIAPLIPYAIRGAIWYQGESNHGEGLLYTAKMRALIEGWRKLWDEGEFPFYYVQIAPFNYGGEPPNILPEFWQAQAAALAIPNTGMAATTDIGNVDNIHPTNKQEVGRRLALLALKNTYGQQTVVADGPVFKSLAIEGDRIRLRFDHADGGLASRDGKPLSWFEIIGEDTDFVPATATIDGDSVLVSSPQVTKPRAVQFGWHRNAEPNLMNKLGLPAYPFKAGDVPRRDWLALKVAEAKGYTLVYDLDLAKLGHDVKYDVDNRARVARAFDRVAYFLELQQAGQPVQYVYVSLDAFTTDLAKIGIPTLASRAVFQQKVASVNVVSNVAGIVNGTGLKGCNIEFWPSNYGPLNSAAVPGASNDLFDFGDQPSDPQDGYGCMQVHNYEAKQTLFALNAWNRGANADLGIGNSTGQTRDWTFTANGAGYQVKRLRVLVHEKQ